MGGVEELPREHVTLKDPSARRERDPGVDVEAAAEWVECPFGRRVPVPELGLHAVARVGDRAQVLVGSRKVDPHFAKHLRVDRQDRGTLVHHCCQDYLGAFAPGRRQQRGLMLFEVYPDPACGELLENDGGRQTCAPWQVVRCVGVDQDCHVIHEGHVQQRLEGDFLPALDGVSSINCLQPFRLHARGDRVQQLDHE